MNAPQADPADIVAMREQGDLTDYLLSVAGRTRAKPKPSAVESEARKPGYHIPRPGAWPCGTAATGPTPQPCGHCPEDLTADQPAVTTP